MPASPVSAPSLPAAQFRGLQVSTGLVPGALDAVMSPTTSGSYLLIDRDMLHPVVRELNPDEAAPLLDAARAFVAESPATNMSRPPMFGEGVFTAKVDWGNASHGYEALPSELTPGASALLDAVRGAFTAGTAG